MVVLLGVGISVGKCKKHSKAKVSNLSAETYQQNIPQVRQGMNTFTSLKWFNTINYELLQIRLKAPMFLTICE